MSEKKKLYSGTQEWLDWGKNENCLRKEDLAKVNSQESLVVAKEAAKKRRLLAGLSAGQAAAAVLDAQRDEHRNA